MRQVFIAGGSQQEWECMSCGRKESGKRENLEWLDKLAREDYTREMIKHNLEVELRGEKN